MVRLKKKIEMSRRHEEEKEGSNSIAFVSTGAW